MSPQGFPGTNLKRSDMKCATEAGYCGGWDKETLKSWLLKAAVCPECSEAFDVDNVAYWLVRFGERQQRD